MARKTGGGLLGYAGIASHEAGVAPICHVNVRKEAIEL
jgi:hypothetical protein